MDGAFYKYGSMLADIMIISGLWFLFSLPIVTAGASTTAAYYVFTRRAANRDGYLWRDFWGSFKSNLWMSVRVFILFVAISILLALNILNIDLVENTTLRAIIYPAQFVIAIELLFMNFYVYPVLSRFEMKFFPLLRAAFIMANKHLLTTLLTTLLFAALAYLSYTYPLAVLLFPGLYIFLTSYFFLKIFKKYRPELAPEEMTDEFKPFNTEDTAEDFARKQAEKEAALSVMEEAARAQAEAIEAAEELRSQRDSQV